MPSAPTAAPDKKTSANMARIRRFCQVARSVCVMAGGRLLVIAGQVDQHLIPLLRKLTFLADLLLLLGSGGDSAVGGDPVRTKQHHQSSRSDGDAAAKGWPQHNRPDRIIGLAFNALE